MNRQQLEHVIEEVGRRTGLQLNRFSNKSSRAAFVLNGIA